MARGGGVGCCAGRRVCARWGGCSRASVGRTSHQEVQQPAELPEPVLKWSKSRRAWVLPEPRDGRCGVTEQGCFRCAGCTTRAPWALRAARRALRLLLHRRADGPGVRGRGPGEQERLHPRDHCGCGGCPSGLPPRVRPALRALGPRAPRAAPQHVGQRPGQGWPLLAVVKKIQENHTLQCGKKQQKKS